MLLVKVMRPFVEFDETLALAMFLSALEGLQSMLLRFKNVIICLLASF